MKTITRNNDYLYLALVIVVLFAAWPECALAQQTVGNSLNQIRLTQLPPVLQIMNAVFYIGSAGFAYSGAKGLKDHTENPGSAKLAPQMAKLGVAGALAAAPSLLGTLRESTFLRGNAPSVEQFPTNF
jgi:hypothetical protein